MFELIEAPVWMLVALALAGAIVGALTLVLSLLVLDTLKRSHREKLETEKVKVVERAPESLPEPVVEVYPGKQKTPARTVSPKKGQKKGQKEGQVAAPVARVSDTSKLTTEQKRELSMRVAINKAYSVNELETLFGLDVSLTKEQIRAGKLRASRLDGEQWVNPKQVRVMLTQMGRL